MQPKRKSTLCPDYAIQTRIQQEDKLIQAEYYDKKMKVINVNTNWFEKNQKNEVKKDKRINDTRVMKELILTNQEIKIRRRARLLELYINDIEMYISS